MEDNKIHAIKISKKATLISCVLVTVLLVASVILTLVLQPGELQLFEDGSFVLNEGENHMTIWKYIFSPILVLTPLNSNFTTMISVLLLIIIIGAVFGALDECGLLVYMVEKIAKRYGNKKYKLLFIITLLMMLLGTTLGISEEVVPLVPFVIMLCYAFGWDSPLALLACDLAACAGFTVGVINPFNTGLAQSISKEITMYSGVGFRLVAFVFFFAVLWFFIYHHAKKVEKNPELSITYKEDLERKKEFQFSLDDIKVDPDKDAAIKWFVTVIVSVLSFALLDIATCTILSRIAEGTSPNAELCASLSSTLSGIILYVIIFGYALAGIGACIRCKLRGKHLIKTMGKGAVSLLPAVAVVLIAGAIGYTFEESGISDTMVYYAATAMKNSAGFVVVLLMLIFVFVLEFFIPSASGKAFLIMPLAYKLCTVLGLNHQLAVLCFIFADGFANSMLPTNSGLLITLGLTPVSYPKWLKTSWKVFVSFWCLAIVALFVAYKIY